MSILLKKAKKGKPRKTNMFSKFKYNAIKMIKRGVQDLKSSDDMPQRRPLHSNGIT